MIIFEFGEGLSDSAWLADLAAHGLVRASFVPPEPIRQLRDLTRPPTHTTRERTREVQRLEKLLEDAGIKLSSVAADITGVSGRLTSAAGRERWSWTCPQPSSRDETTKPAPPRHAELYSSGLSPDRYERGRRIRGLSLQSVGGEPKGQDACIRNGIACWAHFRAGRSIDEIPVIDGAPGHPLTRDLNTKDHR